jgi:hypothetical protein
VIKATKRLISDVSLTPLLLGNQHAAILSQMKAAASAKARAEKKQTSRALKDSPSARK